MRTFLVFSWLALPIAALAWHFGPGQRYLAGDSAGQLIARGEQAARAQDWTQAAAFYSEALQTLSAEDRAQNQRLRWAAASARIQAGDLPEGQSELEGLLSELESPGEAVGSADPQLLAAVRHELGTASYHAAWLLRLEGAAPDEWLPECEQARQQFRLLAEQSGGEEAESMKRNLEAAIRLERMDMSTLLAAPKPKNCPNCKNLSQRKRKQSQSRSQTPQKSDRPSEKNDPEKQDARKAIKQDNAGMSAIGGRGS